MEIQHAMLNSTFPAINNKFLNCFFCNGETGLLIGDGTNSYVQGISVLNCIFVGCVTCGKWYQGTGTLADLIMTGYQFGGSNTQIDINNILHPQLIGWYFLDTLYMLNIDTPNDGTISGSVFFANGTKAYSITILGTQGTGRLAITGNTFFGFNNLDYYPITLQSGTNGNLISTNLFYSCTEFIDDSGTNNMTEYAQPGNGVCIVGIKSFRTEYLLMQQAAWLESMLPDLLVEIIYCYRALLLDLLQF